MRGRIYCLPPGVNQIINGNYDIFLVVKVLTNASITNPMVHTEICRLSGIDSDTVRGICQKLSNRRGFLCSRNRNPKGARLGNYRVWYINPTYLELTKELIHDMTENGCIPPENLLHKKTTKSEYRILKRHSGYWEATEDHIGPYTRITVKSSRYKDGTDRYVKTDILNDTKRYPGQFPVCTATKLIEEGYL